MTGRATFGDFLHLARHHLESDSDPGNGVTLEDLEQVIGALSRLVAVMRRYTQDLTASLPEPPRHARPVLSPWAEACFQARDALASAARLLALRGDPRWRVTAASASPQTYRLTEAARWLRIGRDLLHTHFTPTDDGCQRTLGTARWWP